MTATRSVTLLLLCALAACGEVKGNPDSRDAAPADSPPPDGPVVCGALVPVIPNVTATTTMGECCGGTVPAMLDGSGLAGNMHDCNDNTGWKSNNITAGTVTFDLRGLHELAGLAVWNHGQLNGDRGVNMLQMSSSPDGTTFELLPNSPTQLARSSICPVGAQTFTLLPVRARFVRFEIASGYGAVNTGLLEVQFSGKPCT